MTCSVGHVEHCRDVLVGEIDIGVSAGDRGIHDLLVSEAAAEEQVVSLRTARGPHHARLVIPVALRVGATAFLQIAAWWRSASPGVLRIGAGDITTRVVDDVQLRAVSDCAC